PAPGGMTRFLPFVRYRLKTHKSAFQIRSGRLTLAQSGAFTADPPLILELFAESARLGVDVHPDALAEARAAVHLVADVRSHPRAVQAMFDILGSAAPEVALRLMAESGVIGVFMPEFGRIVGRTQ